MGKGPEWDFMEILVPGKTSSFNKCKACGKKFHGSATRVKEHLLGLGSQIEHCKMPPPNIHVVLHKSITKLKSKGMLVRKIRQNNGENTSSVCIDTDVHLDHCSTEVTPPAAQRGVENVFVDPNIASSHVDPSVEECSNQQVRTDAPSYQYVSKTSSNKKQRCFGQQKIQDAFDNSSMLELHLKWTQAFISCGISFNTIRNPVFQDALMSTARKGFVLPDYNKMRTEYLQKLKCTTELCLQRRVLEYLPAFGCTIAMDGWTNVQKKPMINIMCICPKGVVFLDAIDTSLKEKTSEYIEKIFMRGIAMVGGHKYVTAIVSDNAANYKSAGKAVQERYPEITWVPCAAHCLNLLLKDFGLQKCIMPTLLDANHVVKFIREHQYPYALFKSHSDKCLQIFCATRFATAYYVLERLVLVRPALVETVADRRWGRWVIKHAQHADAASKCADLILSSNFWTKVERTITLAKPFVMLLRLVDSDSFVMGKIYWKMSQAIAQISACEKFSRGERNILTGIASTRWANMHTPLHGAAFALEPTMQTHDQSANKEVSKDFRAVCANFLPGEDGEIAFRDRTKFALRMGAFGDPWHLNAIDKMSPPIWWKEYGYETVELQHIATRVLSVAASSGSCERNWAAFDFVHTKRRNRLNVTRAADLVYCYCNMRLMPQPQNIVSLAAHMPAKQTHDNVAEDVMSEDEDAWEMNSDNSDIEEIDDMRPVLLEHNEN